MAIAGLVGVGSIVGIPLLPLFLIAYYVVQYSAFNGYRTWTLELLTLATSQLLGPDEPMLAGETMLCVNVSVLHTVRRDFAVAATKGHILMFWFTHYDSPVCRVVFVASPDEVDMTVRRGLTGLKILVIRYSGAWWVLRGSRGVFKPEQVLQAWSNGSAREKSQPVGC